MGDGTRLIVLLDPLGGDVGAEEATLVTGPGAIRTGVS